MFVKNKDMLKNWFTIVLVLLISSTIFGIAIYKKITFEQNCSGYLKRAADANTVDIAKDQLKKSIDYIEANNLTNGYTSVFYKTPDEDVSFWYKNIKASYMELSKVNDSTSELERTNILMKLRETLMDHEEITIPDGISRFPDNKVWCFWFLIATILLGLGIISCLLELDIV